jgi:hypothetical protein
MNRTRALVVVALIVAALPLLKSVAAPPEKPSIFTGKIVPVKDLVTKSGGKLDRDAEPYMVALVVDGKAYSIVKDDGGRRFFKDERLLNKEYRITGRLVGGTLLQVISVQSIKDGKLHDIYYWCDICSIRRGEKNLCECCGGPMELREELIEK